jgi:hypothetical protein
MVSPTSSDRRKGGERAVKTRIGLIFFNIGLLAAILGQVPAMAAPVPLSDNDMEQVHAQGLQGLTIVDSVRDSGVAVNGSSSVAAPNSSENATQVGVGGSETNQNQINMAGAKVFDKNQKVINAGGDNKEQNNLNKAVQAKSGGQSANNGLIANVVQGIFLAPINATNMSNATLSGDVSQHNVISILSIYY